MEKLIKGIQIFAMLFLVVFTAIMGSEGSLGVNLTTILGTVSPMALLIGTSIYQVIRYIVPAKTAFTLANMVIKAIGKEKADEVMAIAKTLTPEQVGDFLTNFMSLVSDIPEVLAINKLILGNKVELGVFEGSNLEELAKKHL